jgi:hypothetical protein
VRRDVLSSFDKMSEFKRLLLGRILRKVVQRPKAKIDQNRGEQSEEANNHHHKEKHTGERQKLE